MSAGRFIKINKAGDLEIATLVEHQEAFPDIVNPDLYEVCGTAPDQTAVFHTEICLELFLIRVAELFADGAENVVIDGKNINLSLFGAAKWFRDQYLQEAEDSGLREAIERLEIWMNLEADFEFWCPELGTQFIIKMSRARMIAFAGNLTKHNLLRINKLLADLQRHLARNGYQVDDDDMWSVLEPFKAEYQSRMLYHATFVIEMLYDYFWAFNTIVWSRYIANGCTNDYRKMQMPQDSSPAYQNMYTSLLVFSRYESQIFGERRPTATKYLKMRY